MNSYEDPSCLPDLSSEKQKIGNDDPISQIPAMDVLHSGIFANNGQNTMIQMLSTDLLGVDASKVNSRRKASRWTKEEDNRLCEAINEHGTTNWPAVALHVGGGRTRAQCSQRWNRVINPKINKKNWTKEEEENLLHCVERFGERSWTRVAQQLGDRTDVQCRFKYYYIKKKGGISSGDANPQSDVLMGGVPDSLQL